MPENDWQPIETAPKDGTWVLLYGRPYTGQSPTEVSRYVSETYEIWERVDEATKRLVRQESGYWDGDIWPTHWRPLPAPPEPAMDKESGE